MVERQKIINYVYFNYIPFNKRQCFGRIIIIWIMSAFVFGTAYLFGKQNVFWIIALGIVVLPVSGVYLLLCIKRMNRRMIPRFACDGLFWLSVSILLILTSYLFMTINGRESWRLLFLLFIILSVTIAIALKVVEYNIKSNKYNGETITKTTAWPFVFGAMGVLVARILLQGRSKQTAFQLLSFLLLLLSFLFGIIGCAILLKAFFVIRFDIEDFPN